MYYTINLSQDKIKESPYISQTLISLMDKKIKENKKCILYLNRRGEFSSLLCKDCQNLYTCPRCDISLSVHTESLKCHLCGFIRNIPLSCESCYGNNLAKVGIGTQQIENIIKKLFPSKKVLRVDFDSVKNIKEKKETLQLLQTVDIIIGTKMITTGFDLKNIGLIGIILLEQELMIPQYDIEEKVVNTIKQVIGRSREKEVDIAIQTFVPDNEFTKSVTEDNLKDFFEKVLKERKKFNLPPFSEIAILEYRSTSNSKSNAFIENLYHKLTVLNEKKEFEIIKIPDARKKYNQFYSQIYIKGGKVRNLLELIRPEIVKNSYLTVSFP